MVQKIASWKKAARSAVRVMQQHRHFLSNCVVISIGTGAIALCLLLGVELSSNSHYRSLITVSIIIIFNDP